MSFYPVVGIIAMVLICFSVIAILSNNFIGATACAGLATSVLILGAFFMLVEIHETITKENEIEESE